MTRKTVKELGVEVEELQGLVEKHIGLTIIIQELLTTHSGQIATLSESLTTVARAVNIDPAISAAVPVTDLRAYQ
jgi:hypothetical protein